MSQAGCPQETLTDVSGLTAFSEFYTFTFNKGKGFILVAADDCVTPVLGYSTDGQVRFENMPANLKDWLEGYESQMRYYREHATPPTAEIVAQWEGKWTVKNPTKTVEPMVTTKWGQGDPYNSHCPSAGGDSPHAYTGCTATAMAQIMRYWKHPATGYGQHSYYHKTYDTWGVDFGATTYVWDSMPNVITATSKPGRIDAVATLMYHCGVAVDMGYSTTGSGAFTINYGRDTLRCSEYALMQNFKYRNTLRPLYADDFADDEWIGILKHEFDNGRPVLHTGYDRNTGHAFVADGYDNLDYVHFNWGWTGSYDGYFRVGHLNPGEGSSSQPGAGAAGSYNMQCAALVGIEPNPDFGKGVKVTLGNDNPTMGSVSGAGSYDFGELVTLHATANPGHRFVKWDDGNRNKPRRFYAMGNDRTLSAMFEPLHPDTMHYCTSNLWFGDVGEQANHKYWGIRYPASVISKSYGLASVQFFPTKSANYDIEIFEGSVDDDHKLYSKEVFVGTNFTQEWTTHVFDSVVHFSGDQPVWIRMHSKGVAKAAVYTASAGNIDSRLWGETLSGDTLVNQSWMIRGVFQHPDSVNLEVRCAGNGEVVLLPSKQDVSNSWFAVERGAMLNIGVRCKPGAALLHLFVNEVDYRDSVAYVDTVGADMGEIFFNVDSTTLVRAVFDGWNGIEDIDSQVAVTVEDGHLIITGAEGKDVRVYDVAGREVNNLRARLAPGAYMVQVSGGKARRVVVM